MSAYTAVLVLAQLQAEAAGRGDLDGVTRLLEQRASLLATAPEVVPGDADAIRQTLLLDRQLSSWLRERMLDVRQEAVGAERAARVLSAYAGRPAGHARLIEALG